MPSSVPARLVITGLAALDVSRFRHQRICRAARVPTREGAHFDIGHDGEAPPTLRTTFLNSREHHVSLFHGKVVVIVGATGVLGTLSARFLRAAGADVRLIARTPPPLAHDLTDLPLASADVEDRRSLQEAADEVVAGRSIDGIVHCTGVVAFGGLGELSAEATRELFATNALGAINVISLATELNPGGVLASFTGVAGDMAIVGMGVSCASKSAAKTAIAVAA